MRILLSNDDGILAPGLLALHQAASSFGEVTVVAPDSPRSAAGHSITLTEPLTVQPVHVAGGGAAGGFRGLSVSGSPADCVRLGVGRLMRPAPDLVLSGLNAGSNVGINVFYSGTVAAAAEGAMLGLPAVAFSAALAAGEADFQRLSRLCEWVLRRLLARPLANGELVNVNLPELQPYRPKGVKVCVQSTAGLEDYYHPHEHPDGHESYRIGSDYRFVDPHVESDVAWLREGYITITPLHVDMTDRARMDQLQGLDWAGQLPE